MSALQPYTYGIVIGCSLLIASSAIAGGFAIREQSTTGLGAAFADSAAGSDLSSMFWNPAAVTTKDGLNTVSSYTAILPDVKITPTTGSARTGATTMDSLGLLAGSYVNYQINQQLYVGLSINAPLGLVAEANNKNWGGATYNRKSELMTVTASPTVGYKLTPGLSVAVGLQVEYMKARLGVANNLSFTDDIVQKGDDVGVGFTAGLLMDLTASTKLGVGYRSSVKHKLKGTQHGNPFAAVLGENPNVGVSAKFNTPETVTASIRHQLTPDFAVMANYEWSNWSRLQELRFISDVTGNTVGLESFSWEDSWLLSGGAEMNVNEKITVRTGLGYETSPVPKETRAARLPDSDRIWLSFGGSYKWSEATMIDFGYSHIFFKDSKIT